LWFLRALVVLAHPSADSFAAALSAAAVRGLAAAGHEVRTVDLYREGFGAVLSAEERRAYDLSYGVVSADVEAHAAHVRWAEALVFVFPTWWGGPPAILKAWMERVLVPGVAFELRDGRVRPALRQIRRLVGISTYGSPRWFTTLTGDGGRRLVTRALRMLCARRCRTRWFGLHSMDTSTPQQRQAFLTRIEQELARS
jgi:NAD(P)H dehydrogenase (quinone)